MIVMSGSRRLAALLIAGLAVGVVIVIIFSIGSQTKSTKPANIVKGAVTVTIPANNTSYGGCQCFDPKTITVVIGVNNTVRWVNEDVLPYTVVSDTEYKDPNTGVAFSTEARSAQDGGPFIMPGSYYDFTFREPGSFAYHSIPNPQLKETVVVIGTNTSEAPETPQVISGVSCDRLEQTSYHIHIHLDVFINATRVPVPKDIGILQSSECIYWLHTHSDDGIIHIESPQIRNFTLGQFLDVWQQTDKDGQKFFSSVSSLPVKIYVNSEVYNGSADDLKLAQRQVLTLVFGEPAPETIPTYDFGSIKG